MYDNVQLLIDGIWREAESRKRIEVINPATNEVIGHAACAGEQEYELAARAVVDGFAVWSSTSPFERYHIMRRAAEILRQRSDGIAVRLTMEQGKPILEAKAEILASADIIDWLAEEARRTYGRIIPARAGAVRQMVIKEPVGPVFAITPWNFPISQTTRKVAAALAAGCSMVVKGPQDTPAGPAELIKAFQDAGLPSGVLNLLYGPPAEIADYFISHESIRKVSFTGSVGVGKKLAALAGQFMKRSTMELGGHAPAIVCADVNVDEVVNLLVRSKFRNAGQVCVSPTRFLVQSDVHDEFLAKFVRATKAINVGDGLQPETEMGPVVSERRLQAIDALVVDAERNGGTIEAGGTRTKNSGAFYEPTVIAGTNATMAAMNEEPFGPIALVSKFGKLSEALEEANRLPFGLAAYGFTTSASSMDTMISTVETGMLTINHLGLALAETPFGGVKDSGYGSEGGTEALEPYLNPKFVTTTSPSHQGR